MTPFLTAAFGGVPFLVAALTSPQQPQVPVLEVIKVYGSLATSDCYGKKSPPHTSCQVPLDKLEEELGLLSQPSGLSRADFSNRIHNLHFQWPLKPYGIKESNDKTVSMNKGAETKIFMDELEQSGLYDRRNPTGPLPTSLRPQLNKLLDQEGVDETTVNAVFSALGGGGKDGLLTKERLEQAFNGENAIDYYGFLDLIGKESITWPY